MKTKIVGYLIISFLLGISPINAVEIPVYNFEAYDVKKSGTTVTIGGLIATKKAGTLATDAGETLVYDNYDVIVDETTVTMKGFPAPELTEEELRSVAVTTISWDYPAPLPSLPSWEYSYWAFVYAILSGADEIEMQNAADQLVQATIQASSVWSEVPQEEVQSWFGEDALDHIIGGGSTPLEELLSEPLDGVPEPATVLLFGLGGLALLRKRRA